VRVIPQQALKTSRAHLVHPPVSSRGEQGPPPCPQWETIEPPAPVLQGGEVEKGAPRGAHHDEGGTVTRPLLTTVYSSSLVPTSLTVVSTEKPESRPKRGTQNPQRRPLPPKRPPPTPRAEPPT
jgi:hypothetical protein